jgi:mono/diheme cytochrome c family protein
MRLLICLALAAPLAAQEPPPSPFAEEKAKTLLREQLPCLGCHELDGEGGRIGPPLTTVGERRSAAYIAAMIEDPQRIVPGSVMPRVRMPDVTRRTIVSYLARNAPRGAPPSMQNVPNATATPAAPAAMYAKWCASCHGPRGGGDGPNAPWLPVRPAVHSSAAAMSLRSDAALYDAIAAGGAAMGRSVRMPPFGATLSTTEIRSLVTYIRELCTCAGPAWSRDGAVR